MLIHEAINKVMCQVGVIGKNRTNSSQGGFKYRGVDDILNVISPLLQEHGVLIIPESVDAQPVERVTTTNGYNMSIVRLRVIYKLVALDGSEIRCEVVAEAMDSGDKATSKAMSVAFRTLLIQAFALATGEPDADAESHAVSAPITRHSAPVDDEPPFDPWATNERPMPTAPTEKKMCKHGARKQWISSKTGKELWFCPLDKSDPDVCAAI